MIWLRGVVVWLVLILAESINGTMRIFWLIPMLGDARGHQVGFAIGSLLVLFIPVLFIRWLNASRMTQLLLVGLLWVGLTVVFEICLGRFVLHYSWEQIAADYNVLQGGLMPFGLILLALSPLIADRVIFRIAGAKHSANDL